MDAPSPALLPRALPMILLTGLLLGGAAALAEEPAAAPVVPVLVAIEIEGNTRTDEDLILREMGLVIGQRFAYDDLDGVWDHLEDLGYFAFVDMEYDDDEPDEVTLRVLVEEDMTTEYGPLVRFDRRHKYLLGGRLQEHNFRGRGETVEAALAVHYLRRAELSWQRRWFLGVRGLQARIGGAWENANFVFRPTGYAKWDAGLDLRWTVLGPVYLRGGARYGEFRQHESYTWPVPWRGEGSPTGTAVHPAGLDTHWVLSSGLGLDIRDNVYYPRRGGLAELTVRRWLSDDFGDYTETSGEVRVFVPVPLKQHVLAARAWGRRTDDPAQLDNVLFLGGAPSVRGYRFGSLEGDEGWLLSVEYRAPLFMLPISPTGELVGLGLHLFADAGDAWYEGADPHAPSRSWGGGAHLNLDTLQLRFEAARTDDGDWVFEFMDTFNF
ncbi:MAG: BamA/TamA family outer membrane protein [Candidatus Krumholzibacteriia bacterium]